MAHLEKIRRGRKIEFWTLLAWLFVKFIVFLTFFLGIACLLSANLNILRGE
jgi:hypothetical protein